MAFKVLQILKSSFRVLTSIVLLFFCFQSSAQFIENKGQLDSKILYTKPIVSGNVLISEQGISYLFYDNSKFQELYEKFHQAKQANPTLFKKQIATPLKIKYHSIEQQFIGGKIEKQNIIESSKHVTKYNYFLGNDKSKWATDVGAFDKLAIKDLYPNIDLELFSNGLELKYNFICHPGSNPALIKIEYQGADNLQLIGKNLKIKTSVIEYEETIPISYLISKANTNETISVEMKLEGNILSFSNIPNDFSLSNSTLVIDPKLIFSTYSGSTADNFGFTATYDSYGNMYAGGITTEASLMIPNGRFPATPGAFSETYNGGSDVLAWPYDFPCDITISKYSSDGKQLLYATYLGGSNNEYPHSLVVDKSDNLVILGSTFSANYPVTNNAYSQFKSGGSDIIITKLNSTGSALIGSTFYGGNTDDGLNKSGSTHYFYADDYRGDVICSDDGSIYGVIATTSDDIEIKNGFKSTKPNGIQQGIIFKFSPNASDLIWSSLIGGDKDAAVYSIDFDKFGDIYVSGGTAGSGLSNTAGTVNPNFLGGKSDGFIAKISKDGKQLLKSTYFGSDKYDQIISLELGEDGNVYVVGQTEGVVPIKGTVYNNGISGQFLSMLTPDLNTVLFSTTFGTGDGKPDITINAFLAAECSRIFISGWGGISSQKGFSSTKGLPITNDAMQKTTDGSDFYIIVFGKEFKKLVYATFFGGNLTNDHVDGGTSRFDKKGIVYQSVCSSCPTAQSGAGPVSDFPTTAGVYAEKNVSPRCSNAAFKFALENLNAKPELRDTFFTVRAFDTLSFNYTITDPDNDTINTVFQSLQGVENSFIQFSKTAYGIGKSVSDFSWSPGCQHVDKDTFTIKADVHDRGCPDFKSNTGYIKIKVTPPPVLPPPETLCLIFTKNDFLELSWSAIAASKFFSYLVLYKIFPDGKISAIDTFRTITEGKYLDKNVINPRTQNYTYYMKVVNKCNKEGPLSYKVSSLHENDNLISPTILVTATVIGNKDVSVHWLKSTEPDFASFSLYRSVNTPTLNFIYLNDYIDTFFVDNTVNVQSQSFCYSIVVNDKCGHISKKSNIGCNIILTGESKPFYHVLDWQPYRLWTAGVAEYVLERSVDTGSQRPIFSLVSTQRNIEDHELDYDWGGYWYSIVAYESFKGLSAISRSNSIYLIQPPLLHVPNAFTKNYDGLNETWGFVPVFVKTYHMQVYTRWGEKVFDSENKKQDWDGNYINESKGQEVYIWQVTYTGWDRSTHYQKGTVTVIK